MKYSFFPLLCALHRGSRKLRKRKIVINFYDCPASHANSTTTNKLSDAKAERSTSIRPKKGKMKRTNDSRETSKKGSSRYDVIPLVTQNSPK